MDGPTTTPTSRAATSATSRSAASFATARSVRCRGRPSCTATRARSACSGREARRCAACSEVVLGASTAARMLVRTCLAAAVAACVALASVAAADTPAWRQNVDALGLPLTIVDAPAPRAFLVFVTGDGGFQRVDQELADGIAKHGVTTVALSTFRYFITKQAPAK